MLVLVLLVMDAYSIIAIELAAIHCVVWVAVLYEFVAVLYEFVAVLYEFVGVADRVVPLAVAVGAARVLRVEESVLVLVAVLW